jgi:hypothetical protein
MLYILLSIAILLMYAVHYRITMLSIHFSSANFEPR